MDKPSLIARLRKSAVHWRLSRMAEVFNNRPTMRHAEMLDEAANEILLLTAERDEALEQSARFRALNIPEHLRALDREVDSTRTLGCPDYVWALELLHQSRQAHDAALRMSVRGAPIDPINHDIDFTRPVTLYDLAKHSVETRRMLQDHLRVPTPTNADPFGSSLKIVT